MKLVLWPFGSDRVPSREHRQSGKSIASAHARPFIACATLYVLALASTNACASDTVQTAPTGQVASDPKNYNGDRVTLYATLLAQKVDMSRKPGNQLSSICLSNGSVLGGITPITVVKTSDDKTVASSTPVTFIVKQAGDTGQSCEGSPPLAMAGDIVTIDQTVIGQVSFNRQGFSFGTLLVPFKYHFHSHTFTSSMSVAPYIGWQNQHNGAKPPGDAFWPTFQAVAFAGAAITSVNGTSGSASNGSGGSASGSGTSDTKTFAGFTYGVGLLTTIKDGFHGGIAFGWDRVNATDNYVDNKKPWVSLEIG